MLFDEDRYVTLLDECKRGLEEMIVCHCETWLVEIMDYAVKRRTCGCEFFIGPDPTSCRRFRNGIGDGQPWQAILHPEAVLGRQSPHILPQNNLAASPASLFGTPR
jgi:hypothetical protein